MIPKVTAVTVIAAFQFDILKAFHRVSGIIGIFALDEPVHLVYELCWMQGWDFHNFGHGARSEETLSSSGQGVDLVQSLTGRGCPTCLDLRDEEIRCQGPISVSYLLVHR